MKNEKNLKDMQLNDNELDNVNGGIIFNSTGISGADPTHPYEVLDWRGDVVARFTDYNGAIQFAQSGGYNYDYKDINNWQEIVDLRNRNH